MYIARNLISINLLNKRNYYHKVIDHFENPRNIGSFLKKHRNVGIGLVGAPACGDVMKLSIKVKDNIIIDSKFKTFGCGSAIASSSFLTEYIKGMHIDKAYAVNNKTISDELKLPPVKLHCSMLAQDAIQTAIEDYINKNTINKPIF